jgi:hypothetical protein
MAKEAPIVDFNDEEQFNRIIAHIRSLKGKGVHRVDITKLQNQLSNEQRGFYWVCVCPRCAKRVRELWAEENWTSYDMHEFFKDRYLKRAAVNKNTGELMGQVTLSTMDLTVGQMAEYLTQCIQFGTDMLGIPHNDLKPKKKFADQ